MILVIIVLILQNLWLFIGGETVIGYIPYFDGRSSPDPKKNQDMVILLNILNFLVSLLFDVYFLFVVMRYAKMPIE